MSEPGHREAQEVPLAAGPKQDLRDSKTGQRRIGDFRAVPGRTPTRQVSISEHVTRDQQGVEIGGHPATSLVDISNSDVDLRSPSCPPSPRPVQRGGTQSLIDLLARARAMLGADVLANAQLSQLHLLESAVALARERMEQEACAGKDVVEIARLALDLQDACAALRDDALARRVGALTSVQEALAELRTVSSVERMIELSTRVLCVRCGFDRAVMFRVEGSRLLPASAYKQADPDYLAKVKRTAETIGPFELHHRLMETDMVRTRKAIVVLDVAGEPRVHHDWLDREAVSSYVAAPIVPGGRVIGSIHADVYSSGREVDEIDRDVLHAFAEGYGYAFERVLLVERLQTQREEVRRLVRSTDSVLDELTTAERQLAKEKRAEQLGSAHAAAPLVTADARVDSRFTRRELDVLELLTEGHTNREIANRLVVSEGTVKSYLKSIFRKLRVANRSEAISRYLRMTGQAR